MKALTLQRNNIDSNPTLVMNSIGSKRTSKCTFCSHYQLPRGSVGHCQLLNAPVRGGWKSCSLAMSPFAPSWEHAESAKVSAAGFIN